MGTAPILITYKTLEKIFNKAKNKIYKEHVENYCYDHPKKFKVFYIKETDKYFFPDSSFTVDTKYDYERVKNIFVKINLKSINYNFGIIKKNFYLKTKILKILSLIFMEKNLLLLIKLKKDR